jgi:hypothetical protein
MSATSTSLQSFANSYSPFSSRSQPNRMAQSQTPGLDTLAEGSQYALEQLQLARQASASNPPTDSEGKPVSESEALESQHYHERNGTPSGGKISSQQHDPLVDARSAIRKNSTATAVRRRISRACDQCNQLRTKCDGQQPCAHCIGRLIPLFFFFSAPVSLSNLIIIYFQNLGSAVSMLESGKSAAKPRKRILRQPLQSPLPTVTRDFTMAGLHMATLQMVRPHTR